MSYKQQLTEYRRLLILEILDASAQYKSNERLISDLLDSMNATSSSDVLRTDLSWLAEQGLLTNRTLGEGVDSVWMQELTPRGLDVAKGKITVPGVRRKGPRG